MWGRIVISLSLRARIVRERYPLRRVSLTANISRSLWGHIDISWSLRGSIERQSYPRRRVSPAARSYLTDLEINVGSISVLTKYQLFSIITFDAVLVQITKLLPKSRNDNFTVQTEEKHLSTPLFKQAQIFDINRDYLWWRPNRYNWNDWWRRGCDRFDLYRLFDHHRLDIEIEDISFDRGRNFIFAL